MTKKITTTIQEVNGKYSLHVPGAIIALLSLGKGDVISWDINEDKIILTKEEKL